MDPIDYMYWGVLLPQAQLVLLVVLMAAIVNFFVGTFLSATPERQANGFVGYSGNLSLVTPHPLLLQG